MAKKSESKNQTKSNLKKIVLTLTKIGYLSEWVQNFGISRIGTKSDPKFFGYTRIFEPDLYTWKYIKWLKLHV